MGSHCRSAIATLVERQTKNPCTLSLPRRSRETVPMERTGKTKATAKVLLEAAVKARANSGDADLNNDSTIEMLMQVPWPWKMETSKLNEGSKGNYTDVIERIIILGLGAVKLREATTGRMDRWLGKERRRRVG